MRQAKASCPWGKEASSPRRGCHSPRAPRAEGPPKDRRDCRTVPVMTAAQRCSRVPLRVLSRKDVPHYNTESACHWQLDDCNAGQVRFQHGHSGYAPDLHYTLASQGRIYWISRGVFLPSESCPRWSILYIASRLRSRRGSIFPFSPDFHHISGSDINLRRPPDDNNHVDQGRETRYGGGCPCGQRQ